MTVRCCILGLGNYGDKYTHHRHNVGSRCLDTWRQREDLVWKKSSKFDYCYSELGHYLCRSRLFINQSGEIWPLIRKKWQISNERLLVLVDTLDLPVASFRYRQHGGHAGHNGLRSLIGWMGHGDFPRIYIGIGRPSERSDVSKYVLSSSPPAERVELDKVSDFLIETLSQWSGESTQQLTEDLARFHCS